MSAIVTQVGNLTLRELRAALRQPFYIAVTLVQPMIWLLLFGQLFKSVVHLPGFSGGGSYVEFLTPGVVIMTALFASGWSGMGFIQDMDRGVMDRLLVSPTSRGSMMAGKLANTAVTTVVQTLIVLLVAFALGARFHGGALGVVVTVAAAILLAVSIGSLSNALALLVRREETLIGVAQFLNLPLMFLSSAIMAEQAAPAWMRHVMAYNPVNWAVSASRAALGAHTDWSGVLFHGGLLLAVAVVMASLATLAFRSYQRSV
ncbi:MAG: ABC transporter permease [Streptosporangiales bacterium]